MSLNKTSRQNSSFAVLQYSEIFGLQMVRKYCISFSSTTKFPLKLMFCVIFVNVLVWRRFGVPLFPICAPLFPIRVPLVPICVTFSTHPIQDIFVKIPYDPPPQHTTPFQASLLLLLPLQKFSSYHFLHFPFVFIRVHSCSLVFTRVHSCSIRVHSCSFMFHSCSLVFTRVPFVFHSCSLVFTRVHSCSTRVRSCSLVFVRVPICVVL